MSVEKEKDHHKRTVIKAQEELLSRSINELRKALNLLQQLVNVKERLGRDGLGSKRAMKALAKLEQAERFREEESKRMTQAEMLNRYSQQDKKIGLKANTDHCSKELTLH